MPRDIATKNAECYPHLPNVFVFHFLIAIFLLGADVNGDEVDNPLSQVSQSSRDESSARDISEDSPSKNKDKKKKKGLRTPSFLKKKSKEKKKAAAAAAGATET